MNNPWKLATLGLALTGVTAISTGLTTAFMMRPGVPHEAYGQTVHAAPALASYADTPRAVPLRAVAHPAAAVRPAVATRPVVVTPVAAPVSTVPVDCSTGGQRAMKIVKPGLIGTLAGAGLGAVGGAIADGGKGAGKGALIGGLAGAVLGGGYGAYKTKQECGTIFGHGPGFAGGPVVPPGAVVAPQSTWHAARTDDDAITVYNAR